MTLLLGKGEGRRPSAATPDAGDHAHALVLGVGPRRSRSRRRSSTWVASTMTMSGPIGKQRSGPTTSCRILAGNRSCSWPCPTPPGMLSGGDRRQGWWNLFGRRPFSLASYQTSLPDHPQHGGAAASAASSSSRAGSRRVQQSRIRPRRSRRQLRSRADRRDRRASRPGARPLTPRRLGMMAGPRPSRSRGWPMGPDGWLGMAPQDAGIVEHGTLRRIVHCRGHRAGPRDRCGPCSCR